MTETTKPVRRADAAANRARILDVARAALLDAIGYVMERRA